MTMIHLKTKCLPSPLRPKKNWRRRRNPNPLQIDSPTIQPYNIISPIRVIVDRYSICSEDEIVSVKVTLSHLQPAVCSIGFRAHFANLMNDRFTLSGRISRSGENLLVWLTGSRKDIENAVTFHFFALVLMDSTLLRHLLLHLLPVL